MWGNLAEVVGPLAPVGAPEEHAVLEGRVGAHGDTWSLESGWLGPQLV